jgi:hypothetical protein
LDPVDEEEIISYLRRMGLLEQFVRGEQGPTDSQRKDEPLGLPGSLERSIFRHSLPELEAFERAYGGEEEEQPNPIEKEPQERLRLPCSYETS